MRRFTQIYGMLLALLLVASTAFAEPVLGPGKNMIEFINWENVYYQNTQGQWTQRASADTIQEGDVFVGIIAAQRIKWLNNNTQTVVWNSDDVGPTYDTLTGYFVNKVDSIDVEFDPITNSLVPVIRLTYSLVDPFGIFQAGDFANHVVMKLFSDDTDTIDLSSVNNGIATATNGDLWASLSIDNGYWWSNAEPSYGSQAGADIGINYFGFNVVGGVLGGLVKINDPLEGLYDVAVDIYGHSRINRSEDTSSPWLFESNDPATLATPEPATLLIMGSGLLGLYGVRRRRQS